MFHSEDFDGPRAAKWREEGRQAGVKEAVRLIQRRITERVMAEQSRANGTVSDYVAAELRSLRREIGDL
jgi:hypothetical protein